jgi:hypothetical protein
MAKKILQTMEGIQYPEPGLTIQRAQLDGAESSYASDRLYQSLLSGVKNMDSETGNSVRAFAIAGQVRHDNRSKWPACPGVVIEKIEKDAALYRAGLRAGQVIIRYRGSCVYDIWDLNKNKSGNVTDSVFLDVWKDHLKSIVVNSADKLNVGIVVKPF